MANVSELITNGIGTPATIGYLVRFGLGATAVVGSGHGRTELLGRSSMERFGRLEEQLPRSTGMERF